MLQYKLLESSLDPDIIDELLGCFRKVVFKKNTIILHNNQVSKSIYFIEKGIARHYYSKNNKEFIWWFSKENDFMTNSSFFFQKPIQEIISALVEIQAYSLTYSDFERLCQKSHSLESFVRRSLAEQLYLYDKYMSETFILSATERYRNFLQQFPELVLRIPLIHIASFLRITPETLSRIRAQI